MSFRLLATLVTLGLVLAGCVSTDGGDGLQRMQQNQRNALESAG